MDRRNNLLVDVQKPQWDWFTVQCALRTSEDGRKNSIWQLSPSIFLTNPTSTQSDPNVKLFIDTEKSLNYSNDLGWNWHKSWNLPNISVKLQIKNSNGQQLLSPKFLYAQIFAVKKNTDTEVSDKMTLLDVGIRGQSKMEMIDGHVYFSALKFSSTTYNNEGHNFHLLIAIYIHEGDGEKPKVLTAVISPEIFVDSRRSARDYQQKKFNSFIEPFALDQLQKQFIKRQSKSKVDQEVTIKNDFQGFYNYLTAPNIRHKVKHPVFLAIRFSSCVTIYINKCLISEKQGNDDESNKSKDIIMNLQKKLIKDSQTKNRQNSEKQSSQRLFLFVVRNLTDSLKRKKIMEALESLESPTFQVVEDLKQITEEFIKLSDVGNIVELYKQSYDSLKEFCRKYIPFDMSSSEQESIQDEIKESKKMKMNKFEGGISFSCPPTHLKRRQANIVCNTIHTKDVPQIIKNTKEVKKEIFEQDNEKNPENIGNAFSLSIGSRKNSAFNNLRNQNQQQPLRFPQPEQQQQLAQPQSLQNILCSNLMLNNWLSSVRQNNQKLQSQYQTPQSVYFLQQINIYWELLSQITYQNQLLARSLSQKNQPYEPLRPPTSNNLMNNLNTLSNPINNMFANQQPQQPQPQQPQQSNTFGQQQDLRNLLTNNQNMNLPNMLNFQNLSGLPNFGTLQQSLAMNNANPSSLGSLGNLPNLQNLAGLNLSNMPQMQTNFQSESKEKANQHQKKEQK